jgi:two-component system sensor histidine kinase RegB
MTAARPPVVGPAPGGDDSARINLAWLLRLRWAAVLGQLATLAVVALGMGVPLRLAALLGLIGLEAASNLACAAWSRRRPVLTAHVAGLMALDVAVLTGLLALSGGPYNPFNFLYLVHIALAAAVLPAAWAWALVALSIACSLGTFLAHFGGAHHHAPEVMAIMERHVEGMWVAFAVSAAFIVLFVTRTRRDLADREAEVARLSALAARQERLAGLATLAGGAAHELATPLSTIAVVAKELERGLEAGGAEAESVEDARLIRAEVHRCRQILERMAADAGEPAGEPVVRTPIRALVEAAVAEAPREVAYGLELDADAEVEATPRSTVAALRTLLKNAAEAGPADGRVAVRLERGPDMVTVVVEDHGRGMSAEEAARAGEPFFTTKAPGHGMGLGLFVARAVVERLGGGLELDSQPGRGTTARLRLPRARPLEAT